MSCTLCGAPGVNIKTCPLNPYARAPDPTRHNKFEREIDRDTTTAYEHIISTTTFRPVPGAAAPTLDATTESPDGTGWTPFAIPELTVYMSRMMDDHTFLQSAMINKKLLLLEHRRMARIKAMAREAMELLRLPQDTPIREVLSYLYHLNGYTGSYDVSGIDLKSLFNGNKRIYSKVSNGNKYSITVTETFVPRGTETVWEKDGVRHRIDGPAYIYKGPTVKHVWYIDGVIWRANDLPTEIEFCGIVLHKYWHKNNKIDRDNDLPAHIKYKFGKVDTMTWCKNGMIHRDGGKPAYINFPVINTKYINEIWYQNGKIHRVDGPAIIIYEIDYPKDDPENPRYKLYRKEWYRKGELTDVTNY